MGDWVSGLQESVEGALQALKDQETDSSKTVLLP